MLRRGWAATLRPEGQPIAFAEATAERRAAAGGLAPALDFIEPLDRGFVVAALLALREAPIAAAIAAAEVGIPRTQAERLADLLVAVLWEALNQHASRMGLPDSGDDGPVYAATDMLAWRDAVNWPRLFDAEGRSLATGRMAADAAAEAGAG
jgi:hypothetical protein